MGGSGSGEDVDDRSWLECRCGFLVKGTDEQIGAGFAAHTCEHHNHVRPLEQVAPSPQFWRAVLVLAMVLAAIVAVCWRWGA
jgi:hypothetical protein